MFEHNGKEYPRGHAERMGWLPEQEQERKLKDVMMRLQIIEALRRATYPNPSEIDEAFMEAARSALQSMIEAHPEIFVTTTAAV